ncbi:retrovirus-related pol polyprotein from transposon TNT 1-94 [Tanacetum coccineum]
MRSSQSPMKKLLIAASQDSLLFFQATTNDKIKSLALKAKVTREQTNDDSDYQGGSDEDVDEEEEAEAFNLIARNFQKCLKCDLLSDDWVIDSGFTKHMNRNRRLFTSYKVYDGGHVVFQSNLKGKVVGGCNITHDSITITNVEHVSGLAFNLISVGSQYNANNRTRNEVSTSRLLELLHLDLFGPSSIKGYESNFYNFMIVDDHSNYTWVVFVKSKDDVLEKFKILCKRLENLHDCSIVSIVMNHSSEFDKLQCGSFCEQHGMSYNLSGPFTPQSSKIVKRTHRKLINLSRVMLDEQSIL